jgi:DoxX-like family
MNTGLWVVTGFLAAVFAGAGLFKLVQHKKVLADKGMPWVEDFSAGAVKAIGAAELLGAIGLVLPALVHVAPVLVPVAASCLAVTMVGAIAVHVRRREGAAFVPAAVMLALLAAVAWGRFGPYAF